MSKKNRFQRRHPGRTILVVGLIVIAVAVATTVCTKLGYLDTPIAWGQGAWETAKGWFTSAGSSIASSEASSVL